MSYLIRVLLPDTPGSLGQLADAFGMVDANIQSVDVVQVFPDGTAMDDIVVSLPKTALPDTLITAAQALDGVEVDSIRPFSGTIDRRGQIRMLASIAKHKNNTTRAMEELVDVLPRSITSGWCLVLDTTGPSRRIAGNPAAPEHDATTPSVPPVTSARVLDVEHEDWIPSSWSLLDSALAVAPIGDTGMILIVGRPGGPDFLASEVEHLGNMGIIIGSILKV